jgi:hypothetical protein
LAQVGHRQLAELWLEGDDADAVAKPDDFGR